MERWVRKFPGLKDLRIIFQEVDLDEGLLRVRQRVVSFIDHEFKSVVFMKNDDDDDDDDDERKRRRRRRPRREMLPTEFLGGVGGVVGDGEGGGEDVVEPVDFVARGRGL